MCFGGGTYQLIVQAISSLSLTIWASVSTLFILWIINKIIKIRLDPEDERKGCDLSEHFQAEKFEKNYKLSLTEDQKNDKVEIFRYKPFHVNLAVENVVAH